MLRATDVPMIPQLGAMMPNSGDPFGPIPSAHRSVSVINAPSSPDPERVEAIRVALGDVADVTAALGIVRDAQRRTGFAGTVCQAVSVPRSGGPSLGALGTDEQGELEANALRNAAATVAQAVPDDARLAFAPPALAPGPAGAAGADADAVVEDAPLARHAFSIRGRTVERAEVRPFGELTGRVESTTTELFLPDAAGALGSSVTAHRMRREVRRRALSGGGRGVGSEGNCYDERRRRNCR